MPLSALAPAPYNPRTISAEAARGLRASLKRFGLVQPIVWNRRTKHVVGGHQRIDALRSLGKTQAQVLVVDLPESEEKALNVTLNNPAIAGEFTDDLQAILSELAANSELEFEDLRLNALLDPKIQDIVEDEAPEPPARAVTRPGDLWILGEHRLLCGDAGNATELDRLLGAARIQLVHTDPPYNVRVEPRSNSAIAAGFSSSTSTHHQRFDAERRRQKPAATTKRLRPRDRQLANDYLSEEDFSERLEAWFKNLARALEPGRAFYIWGGYSNWANYPPALAAAGLYFAHGIVWVKLHPVLTRKDFMGNHESCFYGWREGAAHQWLGPHNVTDVWEIKKVNPQAMVHLTEKPVELGAMAMRYSSRAGENVLDTFGGSGATVSAAEQLGRNGFLMEIDPLYCDVIVERWQTLSGKKAKRKAAP